MLDGLLYCHECGYKILVQGRRKSDNNCYTICSHYRATRYMIRSTHCNNYDKLEKAIIDILKDHCLKYIDNKEIKYKVKKNIKMKIKQIYQIYEIIDDFNSQKYRLAIYNNIKKIRKELYNKYKEINNSVDVLKIHITPIMFLLI